LPDLAGPLARIEALGNADDVLDAYGVSMFNWEQPPDGAETFSRERCTFQLVRHVLTAVSA
jgi:hypothetical protein